MSDPTPDTITARCACGAKLRLSVKWAGMRVHCPKCRQMLTVPAMASTAESAASTPAAARPRLAVVEREKCHQCRAWLPTGSTRCARCGYDRATKSFVTEEELRENAGWSRTPDEGPGRRTFWGDALLTLVCFADTNNLIALGFVTLVAVIGLFVQFAAGCLSFIVYGWLAGYYISVLEHAASGEEELPPLSLTEGWIDGIIVPAIKFAVSWLVVTLPADICMYKFRVDPPALIDSAIAGHFAPGVIISGAVLLLGTFCWPAAIMLMTTSSVTDVVRVDRWVQVIGRAFVSYVAMWLILIVVIVAQLAISVVAAGGLAAIGRAGLTFSLVSTVVATVAWVMTMRIIGLFYFHNRQHFPWEIV